MSEEELPFDKDVESLLLNRLDEKPNIIKGCNSDEILICLGIGVGLGLLPPVIITLIFFDVKYGMIVGLLMFMVVTWKMIKIIGSAKLGRPPGFYKQKVAQWLIKRGGYTSIGGENPFIYYEGRWATARRLRKPSKDKSKQRKKN